MIHIGIIGCGVVGNALKTWLENNNKDAILHISDPYKGMNDDISNCDVYFVQIHVPTKENGEQDLDVLVDLIKSLPKKPIYIRTTLLPGVDIELRKMSGNDEIFYMPEFLVDRHAVEDFATQKLICTGREDIFKQVFVGREYLTMNSLEASFAKYTHNVLGALIVTYYNAIYDICRREGYDFEKVRQGSLVSGHHEDHYTNVPGPDGQFGYGGKCFPKDVNACEAKYRYTPLGMLLQPLQRLNIEFRGKDC